MYLDVNPGNDQFRMRFIERKKKMSEKKMSGKKQAG